MNFSKKIISTAVLMAFSSATFAAGVVDTTDIQINVTKNEYVNLLGTVLTSNAVNVLSEAQVDGVTTSLGTLGAEANNGGGCTLAFTSLNAYKLVHDAQPSVFLHDAGTYTVNHDPAPYATDCNQTPSDLSIAFPAIPAGIVLAGTYSDTLTVTITTQ